MSFSDNVRLDPTRVSDRRRRGVAVGGGMGGVDAISRCTSGDSADEHLGTRFSDPDLHVALSAAASVSGDLIREAATGQVDPERWTHGPSDQLQAWFTQGFGTRDLRSWDTLSSPDAKRP